MNAPIEPAPTNARLPESFELGGFSFRRDEYFAHINWKTTRRPAAVAHAGHQQLPARADARRGLGLFLWRRQLRPRDRHHQPLQDGGPLRAARYNATMKAAGVDRLENFPTEQIAKVFFDMLDDWTNEGFDPFAAPQETGTRLRPQARQQPLRRSRAHASWPNAASA